MATSHHNSKTKSLNLLLYKFNIQKKKARHCKDSESLFDNYPDKKIVVNNRRFGALQKGNSFKQIQNIPQKYSKEVKEND